MTHYEALGVEPSASDNAIRKAFHLLVEKHHPDKIRKRASEATRLAHADVWHILNTAYNAIKTPERRAAYDKELRATAKKCSGCGGSGERQSGTGFKRKKFTCPTCGGTGKQP